MANLSAVLKSEIARVARKELRQDLDALRKATTTYRSAIASLKRQIAELEKRVKRVGRQAKPEAQSTEEDGRQIRFSAQRLKSHRAKLGLSAKDYGALVGVSGLSIYKWEAGTRRPRASQLPAIAAVRSMGKREAAAKLAEQGQSA